MLIVLPPHGSSGASGTCHGESGAWPWLNQSCTSNWSHAPASRFSVVAGMNSLRVSSSRLTTRGFGSRIAGSASGNVRASGTLRPKRAPTAPMRGLETSFQVPSTERACAKRGGISPSGSGDRVHRLGVVEVLRPQPRRAGRRA